MFTVSIDYGHGLNTSGKRPPDASKTGEREFKFNKIYGEAFKKQIETYQNVKCVVVNDVSGKVDTSLKERCKKSNDLKANLHISFHCNASIGTYYGAWCGTEVWVYTNVSAKSESYKLASKVAPVLASAMGTKNRGVKKGNLAMVRDTKCTAILLENEFMDSKTGIQKLRDTKMMENAGKKVADCIAQYYGLKKKPTTTTTSTTTKSTSTSSTITYTVKKGDTLYQIAKAHGTTVAKIKSDNGLKDNTIKVGQKLKVKSNVKTHKVVKGESLWSISQKYNTTVDNLKKLNNLKTDVLSIGQILKVG